MYNGLIKETEMSRAEHMIMNRDRPSVFRKGRDVPGLTSKGLNVLSNPFKGEFLIHETPITNRLIVFRDWFRGRRNVFLHLLFQFLGSQKTKTVEAAVHAHDAYGSVQFNRSFDDVSGIYERKKKFLL